MVTSAYMLSIIAALQGSISHKHAVAQQIIAKIPNFDQQNEQHAGLLRQALQQHAVDIGVYTLGGESLLQRGRNHIGQVCLSGGWDKLMFIDSDQEFSWQQLYKIISSPHPIIAGLTPLKTYPISLNYLPFAEDEIHFERAQRTVEGTKKLAAAKNSEIIKVPFVGTAFLCIHRRVFEILSEAADPYKYPNPANGESQTHWDFFKVESIQKTYVSEDWGFCHRARQAGFDVMVDTSVIIPHIGQHSFRAV